MCMDSVQTQNSRQVISIFNGCIIYGDDAATKGEITDVKSK